MATPVATNSDLVIIRHRIRDPIPNQICSSLGHRVSFRHPCYVSSLLFEFAAFDGPNGGLHHGTALVACGIVAGNVWAGWLSEGKLGERIQLGKDMILTGKEYYFHLPWPVDSSQAQQRSGPFKYAVVASFKHWSFPHDTPPPEWSFTSSLPTSAAASLRIPPSSGVSQAVRDRDISCRVSGSGDAINRAHLCPRAEVDWFRQQEMDKYNLNRTLVGPAVTDDSANALALRADVHFCFDASMFVITRKLDEWVSHFLERTINLGPDYHNSIVEMPAAVNPAFVFARLAWAIFPLITNFLTRGENRLVILKCGVGGVAQEIKDLERADLCRILGIAAQAGSNSAKKRQRGGETTVATTSAGVCDAEPVLTPSPSPSPSPSQYESPTLHAEEGDAGDAAESRRIAKLRHAALKSQRPSAPNLCCCDYNAAEEADAAGIEGPRKFGGAHLCLECLGVEYRDELPDDVPSPAATAE